MDTTTPSIMSHYVCSECGNVSKNPGTCQIDDCILQGTPLHECHCDDGQHEGVKTQYSDDDSDAPGNQNVTTLNLDES